MIFKDSKKPIEANINTGGLDHRIGKGFDLYSAGGDLRLNISVT
jgi:hypothetical protein